MKKIVKLLKFIGSFEGEDRMMLEVLPDKGTYLDVGCGTPIKASNTLLLYLNGWSGTCIDGVRRRRAKLLRPRDTYKTEYIESIAKYKDYDLLDLDVDGIDLEILKTMTFYPKWILVECHMEAQAGIPEYLISKGYKIIGMTKMNKLFEKI